MPPATKPTSSITLERMLDMRQYYNRVYSTPDQEIVYATFRAHHLHLPGLSPLSHHTSEFSEYLDIADELGAEGLLGFRPIPSLLRADFRYDLTIHSYIEPYLQAVIERQCYLRRLLHPVYRGNFYYARWRIFSWEYLLRPALRLGDWLMGIFSWATDAATSG